MKDEVEKLDVANWTALRMRKMHTPIKEGLFMAGGKTPHQYLTAEITELINQEVVKARNLALTRAFNRLKSTNRTATMQWLESQLANTESNKEGVEVNE